MIAGRVQALVFRAKLCEKLERIEEQFEHGCAVRVPLRICLPGWCLCSCHAHPHLNTNAVRATHDRDTSCTPQLVDAADSELTELERGVVHVAFKNMVAKKRAAWRALTAPGPDADSR